jgi:hypothetical protein
MGDDPSHFWEYGEVGAVDQVERQAGRIAGDRPGNGRGITPVMGDGAGKARRKQRLAQRADHQRAGGTAKLAQSQPRRAPAGGELAAPPLDGPGHQRLFLREKAARILRGLNRACRRLARQRAERLGEDVVHVSHRRHRRPYGGGTAGRPLRGSDDGGDRKFTPAGRKLGRRRPCRRLRAGCPAGPAP